MLLNIHLDKNKHARKSAGADITLIVKELGGKAIIENGQTLCAKHNFTKKCFGQTETGKKMFIRLYELSKFNSDR